MAPPARRFNTGAAAAVTLLLLLTITARLPAAAAARMLPDGGRRQLTGLVTGPQLSDSDAMVSSASQGGDTASADSSARFESSSTASNGQVSATATMDNDFEKGDGNDGIDPPAPAPKESAFVSEPQAPITNTDSRRRQ